jgi:hypothetical protein
MLKISTRSSAYMLPFISLLIFIGTYVAAEPKSLQGFETEDIKQKMPIKRSTLIEGTGMMRLNDEEIERLLKGTELSNFQDPEKKEISFIEEFYADGRWKATFNMRVLNEFTGRWSIKLNQICVSSSGNPDICRPVYQKPHDTAVWMPEFNFSNRNRLLQLYVTKM